MERVRTYDDFAPANDPYGERNFGAFEHNGNRIVWKVDAYDRDLRYGSPDPAREARPVVYRPRFLGHRIEAYAA